MTSARILIVEDEILIAREIESCLCQIGYTVVGVSLQGEVVPQRIVEAEPDRVLMDIYLHGAQDGIALATEIHDRHQIPVIYVTAYADDDTLEQAKVTHPFGYVIKPFNERDLRVAIELALVRLRAKAAEQPELLTTTPSIIHVYTLRQQTDGQFVFILDCPGSNRSIAPAGTRLEQLTPNLKAGMTSLNQPIVEADLLTNPFGTPVLYGYAPIKNQFGRINGILVIELNASSIIQSELQAGAIAAGILELYCC